MSDTWQERYEQAPVFWHYLSFADDDGFLGGCYVLAEGWADAVTRSHVLGINPGGEVEVVGPIPPELMDENVPESDRGRLLTREELDPGEETC